MGLQTLIILLSVIGFVPDQGSANIPIQKYGLVQGQYLIAQDLDELFPKSKSYSSPVSTPIIKSIKPHGAGFHLSASLGFSELFHSGDDGTFRKPGLTYKISGDYWFGDHFGLGIEFQFLNLFGSSYKDLWPGPADEFNFYISPYVKIGLISRQNWNLFFDLGFGGGEAEYLHNNFTAYTKRIFIKFDLGWSIKIGKNYETGIIIDNKLGGALPDPQTESSGNKQVGAFLIKYIV